MKNLRIRDYEKKTHFTELFSNHLLAFLIVFPFAYNEIPVLLAALLAIYILSAFFGGGYPFFDRIDLRCYIYFTFIVWVFLSSFFFVVDYGAYDHRDVVKTLFVFLYSLIVFRIPLNIMEFESAFLMYVKLLSLMICLLFLYMYISNAENLIAGIYSKLWASDFLPGWPNGLIIPLFYGFYLSIKIGVAKLWNLLIFLAIILILSRAALVAAILVYLILMYRKKNFKVLYKLFFFMLAFIGLVILFSYLNFDFQDYFYVSDRLDILYYALSYIYHRPFVGYGGKTLDQLEWLGSDYIPMFSWAHSHNFILEFVLRYGLIGFILFSMLLILSFFKIKNFDSKLLFVFLIILALFQTHFQEVGFLIIVGSLILYSSSK